MKAVEHLTESIWPDKHGRPWLARLYWARLDGALVCVGAEIRSARLPDRATRRLPAEHSGRLRRMATEDQSRRGRVMKGKDAAGNLVDIPPQPDAGNVVTLKVDGRTVDDIPASELTPERLRELRFGELLEHTARFSEDFAAIGAAYSEELRRTAEVWRASRPKRRRGTTGRRPIKQEAALLEVVRTADREAKDTKRRGEQRLEWIRSRVAEAFPEREGWQAVTDSTIYRWLDAAKAPR